VRIWAPQSKKQIGPRGLGACGRFELRITYFYGINESIFPFTVTACSGCGAGDYHVNCDVLAIRGTILDRGLRTDLELAFYFGIVVNEEFNSLPFLILYDFQRKRSIANRRDFSRLGLGVGVRS